MAGTSGVNMAEITWNTVLAMLFFPSSSGSPLTSTSFTTSS